MLFVDMRRYKENHPFFQQQSALSGKRLSARMTAENPSSGQLE
jgi:hypothetical protein